MSKGATIRRRSSDYPFSCECIKVNRPHTAGRRHGLFIHLRHGLVLGVLVERPGGYQKCPSATDCAFSALRRRKEWQLLPATCRYFRAVLPGVCLRAASVARRRFASRFLIAASWLLRVALFSTQQNSFVDTVMSIRVLVLVCTVLHNILLSSI